MRSNTFKFKPIYEIVPSTWCLIKIEIKEIINKAHPFYKNEDLIEHMYGETIIKNKMTESMIELLLMDLKELEKYSGKCDILYYKGLIMKSITNFWIQ